MATYDRRALLPRVVPALLADSTLTELVVVVDGLRDGSLEYLQEVARTDERVRPFWTENAGATAAQQLGLEHARGDVVVMFDDDQVASPGLASGHAEHHATAGDLVVMGYIETPRPARPSAGSFIVETYRTVYEDDCRLLEREPERVLFTLWGGNVSLRRDQLLRVGWQNPLFDHAYHYDHDFGLRCAAAGLRGVFDRRLHALHLYERPLEAFLAEARQQGRARVLVRHLYPGKDNRPLETGRVVARTIQRMARRPRLRPLVSRALGLALSVCVGLRLFGPERKFGLVLWNVEAQRGMAEETRRLRSGR